MVGEIRDRETAQIGMLGELVLGRSLNNRVAAAARTERMPPVRKRR
jgi:hypothetical protein